MAKSATRVYAYYSIIHSFAVIPEATSKHACGYVATAGDFQGRKPSCSSKSNATRKHPHSAVMGKASPNLFSSHLLVRDVIFWISERFSFEQYGYTWMACSSVCLCSPSTVITCVVWLVGVLRMGLWAGVKMSRRYSQMFPHRPHKQLHQPSPFTTVFGA